MDKLTLEQRHKNMAHIKSKDSKIEMRIRKALWAEGIHYRKNYSKIPGRPDIAITKYKIAIFCDSEFFHGKNWDILKEQLSRGNNATFWERKIMRNIERDEEVNELLQNQGWHVLRFWGKDISKDLEGCIIAVKNKISSINL